MDERTFSTGGTFRLLSSETKVSSATHLGKSDNRGWKLGFRNLSLLEVGVLVALLVTVTSHLNV